jgi:hypothetical protein
MEEQMDMVFLSVELARVIDGREDVNSPETACSTRLKSARTTPARGPEMVTVVP